MFEFIRGEISDKKPTSVVIETGGVGYFLSIPLSTANRLPSSGVAQIWTHHHVREDHQRLFGFSTKPERELFRLLQKVSGVGPALSIAVLSRTEVPEIASAIAEGRVDYLRSLKGVGPKTAQRIITELEDKVAPFLVGDLPAAGIPAGQGLESDAIQALEVLGCPAKPALQAVRKILAGQSETMQLEDLVRKSLKIVWPT
ncbi:MAG: Holliday junction branch migration protein RuvA [Planctomycetota bacterium]